MAKFDILPHDKKVRITLVAMLLFLLISSPFVYRLVDGLLGKVVDVADMSGCPTTAGLLIHTLVFGLVVYLLMRSDVVA
jgi:hypothetical protein